MEKIDQRLGRRQRFLNLSELCVVKAGGVADELNKPVFQHCLTPLVRSRSLLGRGLINEQLLPHPTLARWRREVDDQVQKLIIGRDLLKSRNWRASLARL
jgi:hypothetical protein